MDDRTRRSRGAAPHVRTAVASTYAVERQVPSKGTSVYNRRDMSAEDIRIFTYKDVDRLVVPMGILNDWECAESPAYLDKATRSGRSGTWQFMSARHQYTPRKKHELADDLESVVHLIRWISLRFFKSDYTMVGLRDHVVGTYDLYEIQDGQEIGGDMKRLLMSGGFSGFFLDCPANPLTALLDALARICQEHYRAIEPAPESTAPAAPQPRPAEPEPQGRSDSRKALRLRVGLAPRVAILPAPPQVAPTEKLSSHAAILTTFVGALRAPHESWSVITKVEDQFAGFRGLPYKRRIELSSY